MSLAPAVPTPSLLFALCVIHCPTRRVSCAKSMITSASDGSVTPSGPSTGKSSAPVPPMRCPRPHPPRSQSSPTPPWRYHHHRQQAHCPVITGQHIIMIRADDILYIAQLIATHARTHQYAPWSIAIILRVQINQSVYPDGDFAGIDGIEVIPVITAFIAAIQRICACAAPDDTSPYPP